MPERTKKELVKMDKLDEHLQEVLSKMKSDLSDKIITNKGYVSEKVKNLHIELIEFREEHLKEHTVELNGESPRKLSLTEALREVYYDIEGLRDWRKAKILIKKHKKKFTAITSLATSGGVLTLLKIWGIL